MTSGDSLTDGPREVRPLGTRTEDTHVGHGPQVVQDRPHALVVVVGAEGDTHRLLPSNGRAFIVEVSVMVAAPVCLLVSNGSDRKPQSPSL